jgi:hypothetical protein
MVLPRPSYLSEGDESDLVHLSVFRGSMFSGNRVIPLPWLRGSCVIGEPGKAKGKKTRGLMIGESRKRVSPIARCGATVAARNRETVEPWNRGTVEPWNRGTVEP